MGKYRPPTKGVFKVRPGRRVIWLARPSRLSLGLSVFGMVVVVLALIVAGVPIVPMVWYRLAPKTVVKLEKDLAQPVAVERVVQPAVMAPLPPLDPTLPQGGWVIIDTIGLKTEILEAEATKYDSALKKGVWRVPDFGTPLDQSKPMILAAHRYGYISWSNAYRRLHSFYNLPKVKAGDKIEVYWGQRRYTYEVYGGDQGTKISDYSADLILYTCQYLESSQRIFRYARLMDR